jgi:hypothetical protein
MKGALIALFSIAILAVTGLSGSSVGIVAGSGPALMPPRMDFRGAPMPLPSVPPAFPGATRIFLDAPAYGAGSGPRFVATGDFNGDGKPDIAVANFYGNSVSILLGNGDGTYQPQVVYPVVAGPSSIVVADLNGDGKLDLVVANCGPCFNGGVSNTPVSVFLGNGDGTFQPRVDYRAANGPVSVVVADFNGDGKLDLGVLNYCGHANSYFCGSGDVQGSVSILLGNGDGTFQAQVGYATGYSPESLALGDFNGDGKLDLAVANTSRFSNSVGILLGRGDGTFRRQVEYATAMNPGSVAVGDFNGDGNQDLAVAAIGCAALFCNHGYVSILLGNGDGTFRTHVNYPTGTGATAVAVADLNGDGIPDLAVADAYNSTVSVLLGNGDGTFKMRVDYVTGGRPYSVAIRDMNGDGKPDLLIANVNGDSVSVLAGDGHGHFEAPLSYGVGFAASLAAVGDFNGDGLLDLAVANYCGSDPNGCFNPSTVSILLGKGDGTFQSHVDYATGTAPAGIAVGDFNRDGKLDIVTTEIVLGQYAGAVNLLLGNGDGTFQSPLNYPSGAYPEAIAVGDFNRDGKLDVATVNLCMNSIRCGSPGSVSILLGNGDGTFQRHVDYPVGDYPVSIALADFNGDGKIDIVVGNAGNPSAGQGGHTVSVLLGKGDGTFRSHVEFDTVTFGSESVAVGDFNGDGKADIAVLDECGSSATCSERLGVIALLLGNGDGTFRLGDSYSTGIPAGDGPASILAGDFNGDKRLDLAMSDSNSSLLGLLLGNGEGTFQPPAQYSPGNSSVRAVMGDFNRDGRPDLAVVMSQSSPTISVLLNATGTR